MDLLELMYNGKFPPFYALNLWNEEYAKLVNEYAETEEKIIKTCPEVKELFEHYQESKAKSTQSCNTVNSETDSELADNLWKK